MSPTRAAPRRGAVTAVPITLLVLAAVLRLSTLGHQSFWYDEAYTPVHVLHPGLGATLRSVAHTENTPPLWYVLIWLWSRLLGTSVLALRSLSALAGLATVALAWPLGRELGGRRTAIVLTAIVATNPLFIWYSQEARAYALFTLLAEASLLWFLRARRAPTPRTLAAWSLASILALSSHYFAAFLVGPQALLILAPLAAGRSIRGARMSRLLAVGAVLACGLALVPLIAAQGAHGTQWIGRWALSSRLVAIPGYFLLGGQSSVFGHALLLLCAVPVLVAIGLLPGIESDEWRAGRLMLGLGVLSLLIPLALIPLGRDYLAPRNVIASWIALSAALAVLLGGRRAGRAGLTIAGLMCLAGFAVVVAIDLSPRLQRGDWSGVAAALHAGSGDRAVVTVELGGAPLEYYLPVLHHLGVGHEARVSEIDVVGYRPLRPGVSRPPTPAFHLVGQRSLHGLLVYRFLAGSPQLLSEAQLRARRLTAGANETLVSAAAMI